MPHDFKRNKDFMTHDLSENINKNENILYKYLLLFCDSQYLFLVDHGYDLNQWSFHKLVTIWRYWYVYYTYEGMELINVLGLLSLHA